MREFCVQQQVVVRIWPSTESDQTKGHVQLASGSLYRLATRKVGDST
jgi:hypothetical protein